MNRIGLGSPSLAVANVAQGVGHGHVEKLEYEGCSNARQLTTT